MKARAKVTKEVLCEEARFILANVMAEARYGRQNRYEDIRRVCEGAVSIPFAEYITFLEKAGYLRQDRGSDSLEVTPEGEQVVDSRYEKLAVIGSGGIGTVYRTRQVPLNREVALKEIRDLFGFFSEDQRHEIVRRFTEIVRSAASLAHPNILPIHDVNLDRDFP